MKEQTRKLLSFVLLAVFLVSTAMMIVRHFDQQEGSASYSSAEQLAGLSTESTQPVTQPPTEAAETTEATEALQPVWVPAPVEEEDPYIGQLESADLSALRQTNEAVVGWILIPDTSINYPVTQGEDNEFYLTHTWDMQPNSYGAIFLEAQNSADFSDFNTIVYGHNMRDGSMFAGLHDYAAADFWSAHPYVYLVTDAGIWRYEVFSSYDAKVDSQTYGLSFRQTQTREAFIQAAVENSQIATGITPAITDRILTLSTCTGLGYGSRRVVHARLRMIETLEAP